VTDTKSPTQSSGIVPPGHKPKYGAATHYVYLMENGSGAVKIGHSKDPIKRIVTIRSGSSTRVELVKTWEMTRGAALNVEEEAHRLLSYARLSGEWFKVSPAYAESILTALTSRGGDAESLALTLRAMDTIIEIRERLEKRSKVTNAKGRQAVDVLKNQIQQLRNAEKCLTDVALDLGLNDVWAAFIAGRETIPKPGA
jgi:hypothetical protein